MTVNDTDLFLVNRSNSSYNLEAQNLMAELLDDDLMLVNRGGTSYKATGKDIKDGLEQPAPPVVNNVSLIETNPDADPRFTSQSFVVQGTMTTDGIPTSMKTIDAHVDGTLSKTVKFDEPLESSSAIDGAWTAAAAAEANYWQAVTYGELPDGTKRFVAVAADGTNRVMYSPTGENGTWTYTGVTGVEANYWQSVTYGNGKFVAVAQNGTNHVMHSTNGINWNAASATEVNGWRSVTYGELPDGTKRFVAVASDGTNRVMYSENDGITWKKDNVTGVEANQWYGVTYGNGKFVAVSHDGTNRVMHSTDGISWTATLATEANSWNSVTYGNGKFVAVAQNGTNHVMYSDNGISWTAVPAAEASGWYSVTYANGKFVAVAISGAGNRVMYSTDGISWTAASATEANQWYSVTYGNGKFVAVAATGTNRVMWSYTGTGEAATALTFANGTDMSLLEAGDAVSQGSTTGTVGSITDTTATLSSSAGTWVDGEDVTGPQKTIVEDNTRLYCAFDSSGNITDLQNNPQDPPYTTQDSNPGLTLTFPATFPSGQTPDDELPEGTTLTVDFAASNSAGTSGPVSATVQPEGPAAPTVPLAGLTTLHTGNGTSQSIVNGIDLAGEGGMVWTKRRDAIDDSRLFDTQSNSILSSSLTHPALNGAFDLVPQYVTFNSDGFYIPNDSGGWNKSAATYASWTFGKAAGYFDVVTYTGDGTAGKTVSHNLGSVPGMIIVKKTSAAGNWCVYHRALGFNNALFLHTTAAAFSSLYWNSTSPTASDFTLGSGGDVNASGDTYVAYLFADDTPGVIKCGSYPINNTSGTNIVDCGFKPQWLLHKTATGEGNAYWEITDSVRGTYVQPSGPTGKKLVANSSAAEGVSYDSFEDNGFIHQRASGGGTGIYVAIAAPPPARSQTAEEFVDTQLNFLTYNNRKQCYEGEQAEANKDVLRNSLLEQGFDQTEVTTLLPINETNDNTYGGTY